MRRRRGLVDASSSVLIHACHLAPGLLRRSAFAALLACPLWLPPALCAQEAVSPLPPPVTRGLYRSRWFEFLNAHLEDDPRAAMALADMEKTARAVGVHRLSDFSRTAVYEGRQAEAQGRLERARRAYAAALELDDANLDAHLSRIRFLLRQRAHAEAARALPEAGVALLATHESRLDLFSAVAIWAATGFAAAVLAFLLVLVLHHVPRIWHNVLEVSGRYLGPRTALPLALILLALPFALHLELFWAGLCGGALVFLYASKSERWVLGLGFFLLGLLPLLLTAVARENIVERSPLFVAAVDLEEQREDASAEDGLRQASAVFPEDSDVWLLLGMYAERSGDSERALASYDHAIQADANDYRALLNRGNVHFQEGDLARAIRDYDAAGQLAPRAAEIYYNLSIARLEAYDFDGQAAAIARARQISESKVRGWADHPTLARVVTAPYPLSRARQKINQWNAQQKSRRLPGHVPPFQFREALLSPFTLGPWIALALALLLAVILRSRRALAGECIRCGKTFCSFCKRLGEPALYCSDCVRFHLRKESTEIGAHVALTQETQRRTRWRDWSCRIASLVLPGAHLDLSERPVASVLTLSLFLLLVAVAAINLRFFDPRALPPPRGWNTMAYVPLALSALVWLWSQRAAWKESHGP